MTAALPWLSTWDWETLAAIPVLLVAAWFATAGLIVTREAHDEAAKGSRQSLTRRLRDREGT